MSRYDRRVVVLMDDELYAKIQEEMRQTKRTSMSAYIRHALDTQINYWRGRREDRELKREEKREKQGKGYWPSGWPKGIECPNDGCDRPHDPLDHGRRTFEFLWEIATLRQTSATDPYAPYELIVPQNEFRQGVRQINAQLGLELEANPDWWVEKHNQRLTHMREEGERKREEATSKSAVDPARAEELRREKEAMDRELEAGGASDLVCKVCGRLVSEHSEIDAELCRRVLEGSSAAEPEQVED